MYDSRDIEFADMSYPSESRAALYADIHAQHEALVQEEENRRNMEELAAQREYDEAVSSYNEYAGIGNTLEADRVAYLESVKNALLCESLLRVYKESYATPLSNSNAHKAKCFIMNFIKEQGANDILRTCRTKSRLLSELSQVVDKAYDKVIENADAAECDENIDLAEVLRNNRLTQDITDDFYSELNDIDINDAASMIKERVSDTIADFIDTNTAAKLDYQEILDNAKDQIDSTSNEEYKEDIQARAEAQIMQMENYKDKSVFQCMIEAMTKQIFKNDDLKAKYIKEGTNVDMDAIVENAQIAYTLLEMVNTLGIINVDEAYIAKYLDALNK